MAQPPIWSDLLMFSSKMTGQICSRSSSKHLIISITLLRSRACYHFGVKTCQHHVNPKQSKQQTHLLYDNLVSMSELRKCQKHNPLAHHCFHTFWAFNKLRTPDRIPARYGPVLRTALEMHRSLPQDPWPRRALPGAQPWPDWPWAWPRLLALRLGRGLGLEASDHLESLGFA